MSLRRNPGVLPRVTRRQVSLSLSFRKAVFDTPEDDPDYNPLPEERPGGFAWGEGQRLGG